MNNKFVFFHSSIRYFTLQRRDERATLLFVRSLIIFAILKCITIWSVADAVLPEKPDSVPGTLLGKLLLLPSILAESHYNAWFTCVIVVLIAMLFFRPNYLSNIILFWIALNLFKIKFPLTNGSDYVLMVLTMYTVPLSFLNVRDDALQTINISVFNLFKLLAQIQVALIYLISGWDKLLSPVWTSGKAFLYITNLETIFNPFFFPAGGKTASFILSWMTIAFEIFFVVLIWQKRTRLMVVCAGIVFHLVIWFMLSLPDFALLMILSYLLFLRDSDLSILLRRKNPTVITV